MIDEKEIKELEKEVIDGILRNFVQILSISLEDDIVYEFSETTELKLCLKFLESIFFEKRYKGINEIKNMIDRISFSETLKKIPKNTQMQNPSYQTAQKKALKWLNHSKMVDWLLSNKIIEIIFLKSFHI